MAEEKKVVTLDDFEQRLMVSGLMDFRNDLLRDEKPTTPAHGSPDGWRRTWP